MQWPWNVLHTSKQDAVLAASPDVDAAGRDGHEQIARRWAELEVENAVFGIAACPKHTRPSVYKVHGEQQQQQQKLTGRVLVRV